ncbi:hypothetical protein Egran_04270 [Elaphomyces granulatus]|uniref:Mediator of RNA polymerase II transcription subunit 5 n=1 Tax=Elaphomyces granulatus TaxID=519963 RepID=A0A232LV26_9EURO|nr:hypothetical protein Egran_04270 [Elaphomyces granulatus]
MGTLAEQWKKLLQHCFTHRRDVNDFRDLAKFLFRRCPLPEQTLLDVVFDCRAATNVQWDPLVPLYIHALFELGMVKIPGVLDSLLKHSSVIENQQGKAVRKPSTFMSDTRILQDTCLIISSGSLPRSVGEAILIFTSTAEWISAVATLHTTGVSDDQQVGGPVSSPDTISLFETLGILLATVSGTEKGLEALSSEKPEAFKVKLGHALSVYLPLSGGVAPMLRNRLDSLQKDFNLYGEANSKSLGVTMMDGVHVNALEFEASVIEGPILVGRPLVDDRMLINYLSNRYGGHHDALAEELITATFDVLSNAMYRNESSRTMFVFRSFLVNKLPPFLASMATSSIEPIPMELCISHALSKVDPHAFPSFSQIFEMKGNTGLSEVRQEFLFACASHRLIPESSIERLLGENPMQTLPVGGRYVKDELVSQITGNTQRADQLIAEMESMEGNAGAIVGAVTEPERDNDFKNHLQFTFTPAASSGYAWRWDEDQGENQPVYDEFGSILLLVLAFSYRYDLSQYDLGISGDQSFVLKLLGQGSCSQKLNELSETQHKNLGAWISGLFIAEGITEETMSACSPQEFYLLVATLFSQSVSACEAGKLEFETLKGGFDYLLEPFLLPSLVVALTWLGSYIWETESDPTIPLRVLHSLVRPSAISGEAEAFHRTVLYITSRSLEEQLRDVRTNRTDIKPLLDTIEPYLSFQKSGNCRRQELETWTSHSSGGLLASIRNTLQSLVLWSTNPEISTTPSYTHRQLLAGVRILGSTRVLPALIEEVKLQTEAGSGDLALDIAAAFICSPLTESFAVDQSLYNPIDPNKESLPRCPILTLRDALILQHENVPKISEKDPLRAEVIVRLYRRVNALLSPPSQMTNLDVTNIIENMNLESVTGEHMGLQSAEQVTGGGVGAAEPENINQMLNEAAAAGVDGSISQSMNLGNSMNGMDTSIDDVLNAADMGVDNPEYLDLELDLF